MRKFIAEKIKAMIITKINIETTYAPKSYMSDFDLRELILPEKITIPVLLIPIYLKI